MSPQRDRPHRPFRPHRRRSRRDARLLRTGAGFPSPPGSGEARRAPFRPQKINVHQADRTFEPKAKSPTPGAGDFCLVTTLPLADAQARIAAAGVAIECGPIVRQGAAGAMTSIYFRDPDGNLVEVSAYDAG